MMLTYVVFALRSLFHIIDNRVRNVLKAPDFVIFQLEGDYPELPQEGVNPIIRLFRPPKTSLLELSEQIRTVRGDPRIKGVIFYLRPLEMPLAKIDVLRNLIKELKISGKMVLVWSYTYDTTMYYLATAADRIALLPGGMFGPIGLYQRYLFLGDALKMAGIKAEFIQISPYKSTPDMFTREKMSEQVREMANWLTDSTYDGILEAISKGRNVDRDKAKEIVDHTPCTDLAALEIGAVDELVGEDELPELLGEQGEPAVLQPWESAQRRLVRTPLKIPGKYIALMSVEGLIIDGHSGQPPVEPPIPVPVVMDNRAGDLSVVQTTRQILKDPRAVGVIVYVNSRGGSVTASESMRNALNTLSAKKPMIVVMGPAAASGGYWVSTPARLIYAQSNSITGSIGVFAGKIVNAGLLQNLRVNLESIQRGEFSHIYESAEPFTEADRKIIQTYIQRVYDMFLERVSISRDMERDAVDSIGGGRVWTGRQALENGLIDFNGGINEAIEKMREIASLDPKAGVRYFTPQRGKLPPAAKTESILIYGFEGASLINNRVLCLSPWLENLK
jgi:protease-4